MTLKIASAFVFKKFTSNSNKRQPFFFTRAGERETLLLEVLRDHKDDLPGGFVEELVQQAAQQNVLTEVSVKMQASPCNSIGSWTEINL